MPHIIVEYSVNLQDDLRVSDLVATLHQAALDSGVFPVGGTRTRAVARTAYRVADGDPDNGFVHVSLRIGHGRDLATRQMAAQAVFGALTGFLDPLYQRRPLALSLELQEIDPDTSFRQNNLHDHVRRRQAAK